MRLVQVTRMVQVAFNETGAGDRKVSIKLQNTD